MPADPPCPDLDALEQALAGMTPRPWRYGALEHGGRYVTDGRGYLFAQVDDDGNGDGIVAAVNALPGLIAEVRRLRAALANAQPVLDAADRLRDAGIACSKAGVYTASKDPLLVAWAEAAGDVGIAAFDRAHDASRLAAPARTDEAT